MDGESPRRNREQRRGSNADVVPKPGRSPLWSAVPKWRLTSSRTVRPPRPDPAHRRHLWPVTYTYNQNRGWPTQILWKAGTTPFGQYDLVYDGGYDTVGNLTQVTELDTSVVSYTYDTLYRLTAETRTGTGAYTRSYGYDLAGNMTTYGGSTFASYDSANKISSLSGGSISYDADGNTSALSGTGMPSTTLTWDVRNKLTRQQTSTDDLSYRYDYSGKRTLRWPTGTTGQQTFYVFSGDTLIGEIYSGSPTYAYTWGSGGMTSSRSLASSQSLWYHFGPQGESRQLTDATSSVADAYRYDGYGQSLLHLAATSTRFDMEVALATTQTEIVALLQSVIGGTRHSLHGG